MLSRSNVCGHFETENFVGRKPKKIGANIQIEFFQYLIVHRSNCEILYQLNVETEE